MKRFVILDPGMRQRAGHYYEYNMALRDAAAEAGYDVSIYAHRDWQEADCAAPYFICGVGHGSALKRYGHKVLSLLPPSLRAALFAPARFVYRRLKRNRTPAGNAFAEQSASLDLSQGALILAPSSTFADILGSLPLCAARPDAAFRFVVRQLPQDEGERVAFASLKASFIPANVEILSDTNDLVEWMQGQGVAARLIPIPMKVPEFVFENPEPNPMFTFAMLGPARAEKGIAHMPALIRAFEGTARFVIQTTLIGGRAPEPEVEKAIAELKTLQKKIHYIELIDGDLSEEEFYRAICDASCLLIPYDRERYKARSSGLLVQSYLCGRPAIVPSGTWMADQTPEMLAHTIWRDDLAAACRAAMTREVDMSAFTQEWRKIHSPAGTFAEIARVTA